MNKLGTNEKLDMVNKPPHYTSGQYEVIDFIEQSKLNYHLGNVVKYICRYGKKSPKTDTTDLKKALWYLKRFREKRDHDMIYSTDFTNDQDLDDELASVLYDIRRYGFTNLHSVDNLDNATNILDTYIKGVENSEVEL